MMKLLVTGGAGFIGSAVAAALIGRGAHVVLLDDFNSFVYSARLKEARIRQLFPHGQRPRLMTGTILDADWLGTVFAEEKFDAVVHMAAHANPLLSVQEPNLYTQVNVIGTINLLQLAVHYDVLHFIIAGSSSVYSDEQVPFREDQLPLRPRSPYGASKAAAEVYCSVWHDLHGLPITVLRFFSVYGPWGRPDMAPMIFARQILQGEMLEVTADRSRDLTYIDDAVAGIVASLDHRHGYEVINIGSGQPVELMDLIAALERAAGKKAQVTARTAPLGEMRTTCADITKARHLLGFEPKVRVEVGAEKLIHWLTHEGKQFIS